MTYRQIEDGEWVWPKDGRIRSECCDCGLVHVREFRVIDGHIEYRSWRDERATRRRRARTSHALTTSRTVTARRSPAPGGGTQ